MKLNNNDYIEQLEKQIWNQINEAVQNQDPVKLGQSQSMLSELISLKERLVEVENQLLQIEEWLSDKKVEAEIVLTDGAIRQSYLSFTKILKDPRFVSMIPPAEQLVTIHTPVGIFNTTFDHTYKRITDRRIVKQLASKYDLEPGAVLLFRKIKDKIYELDVK
ncbi:hypothetical protein ABWK22_22875 [Gottfriedia acidiceleris]|uniref:hypothetical protein n=1 Tax=Gottfriedia acidiceleris TaxID=371036 RepID=UPI0033956FA8